MQGNATALVALARKETDLDDEEVDRAEAVADGRQGGDRLHARNPQQVGEAIMIGRHSILAGSPRNAVFWLQPRSASRPHLERPGHHSSGRKSAVPVVPNARRRAVRRRMDRLLGAGRRRRAHDVLLRLGQRHHVRERSYPTAATAAAACRLEPSGTEPAQPDRPADSRRPGRSSSKPPAVWWCCSASPSATVERIRVFSEDCELDAGGRPVMLARRRPPSRQRGAPRVARGPRPDRRRQRQWTARSPRSRFTAIPPRTRRSIASWRRLSPKRAPQGDVLAGKRARRTWAGDSAARVARRSEHRGSEERRVRRLPKPRAWCVRRARRIWRAATPEPRVRSEAVFWIAQKNDKRRRRSSCRRSRRMPHPRSARRRYSR